MNELINSAVLTMSSREIAELVNSRHDKVKQSIERLAARGIITLPPLGETSFIGSDGRLQHGTEYRIGKRDSYVIVAQLSPEFTARLVDRWQQLEAQAAQPQFAIPKTLPEALRLAADESERADRAESALALAAPKVEALDRIATADGSLCLTDAAKALQVMPRKFIQWVQIIHWIYRRPGCASWIGYQDKVQTGYLEHKVTEVPRPDGTTKIVEQVRVTPKGLTRLSQLLPAT